MGSDYLIDTNTLIYLLDKKLPPSAESFLATIVDESCQLSVISQIELLSWRPPRTEDTAIIEAFVADCHIIDLSPTIVQQTVRLRQTYKVKLPDAVIAATALVNDWTLISEMIEIFAKLQV